MPKFMLAFAYNISFNLILSRTRYHCVAAWHSNKSVEPRGWTSEDVKREPENGMEKREERKKENKAAGTEYKGKKKKK